MSIDHSQTYKKRSLRNLPHRLRLNAVLLLLDSRMPSRNIRFADFGCSNGYITDLVANRYSVKDAYGFDCEADHLAAARERYPGIQFGPTDLNDPTPQGIFDLVTCFETLEHVGKPENALRKLLASCKEGGRVIITVPIETGLLGLSKFLAKVIVYRRRYRSDLDEVFDQKSVGRYICWLVLNKDISTFRDVRTRWGSHFGFDYRIVDRFLHGQKVVYDSWRSGTTRFYVIEKQTKTLTSEQSR